MTPTTMDAPFHVDLRGHTALVTGAGEGVGLAIALALAAAGAAVVAFDINPDGADRAAQQIIEAGGRVEARQGDVCNRFQASAAIEAARDAFGRVTILVNAAGVFKTGAFGSLDEWDWRRVIDVNLTGAFFFTQLVARVMADEGGGTIINIASAAGAGATLPTGAAYVSSKAGLIGLTQQSARELAPLGVRINAVCPAVPADAAGVAAAVLFLASNAAAAITGQSLHIGTSGDTINSV